MANDALGDRCKRGLSDEERARIPEAHRPPPGATSLRTIPWPWREASEALPI